MIPSILIILGTLFSAVIAFGTHPALAQYSHGIDVIVISRRLAWPLAAAAIVMCLTLIVLVISGKRKVWWLLGLLPVAALFAQRFNHGPMGNFAVVENPPMVAADAAATFLQDIDPVVGIIYKGSAYAFPYSALLASPVVIQQSHESRFIVIWSPFANRAVAYSIDREIKRRELEIVSMPANAILLYNGRCGQFINGITGQTTSGQKPLGFRSFLPAQKLSWGQWRQQQPLTQVMVAPAGDGAIPAPLSYPCPPLATTMPANSRVTFIATTRPVAVPAGSFDRGACNFSAGATKLLVFRDRNTGRLRVFDRQVLDKQSKETLFPVFRRKIDPKHPSIALVDDDSNTLWTADGKAVEGIWKDARLRPIIEVDEDAYWGVMKMFYPAAEYLTPVVLDDVTGPPAKLAPEGRTPRTRHPRTSTRH